MTLVETTCCHIGCGVTWALESGYEAQKRRDKSNFYCPIGESDVQRANREKSRADNEAANALRFRREAERLRRELKALKKK
jgi:Rieske Fe-S protein